MLQIQKKPRKEKKNMYNDVLPETFMPHNMCKKLDATQTNEAVEKDGCCSCKTVQLQPHHENSMLHIEYIN